MLPHFILSHSAVKLRTKSVWMHPGSFTSFSFTTVRPSALFSLNKTICLHKPLHDHICSISSSSLSIRWTPLDFYWVIIFTEQSNCNVNAGMMVGRARVKAQTQIRLALIKQRRLKRWQPNLAHESPRRLPTPILRRSAAGSEWRHDSC